MPLTEGRLADWNRMLEARVLEQVDEIERMSRLRRFLSPTLAELILTQDEAILDSHRREIAVLFADLRGWTDFSATTEPEEVMAVALAKAGVSKDGVINAAPVSCSARATIKSAPNGASPPSNDATGEHGDADDEHATSAEHVGCPSAEQQEAAEGECVGAHDPLQVLRREGEIGLNPRLIVELRPTRYNYGGRSADVASPRQRPSVLSR